MYSILHIDDPDFTDEHWRQYHELLESLHIRFGSQFLRYTWEEFKERVQSSMGLNKDLYRFVVTEDDGMVAWAEIRIRHVSTEEQMAFFLCDALFEEIPRELAHVIGIETIRLMDEYGCDKAFCMLSCQRVAEIPRMWGSIELNHVDRYQLERAQANYELIDTWLEEIPAANPELELKLFTEVPDELIEPYATTFTDFLKGMPSSHTRKDIPFKITPEDVRKQQDWRREREIYCYTFILFDEDKNLIGHTNGFIHGKDPADAYQAMTGLIKKYRGRGLAKWLKAELFRKIGEDFPDNVTMTTEMRSVNEPIQAVNAQMGYELQSQGSEFEIRVEDLRRFLGA